MALGGKFFTGPSSTKIYHAFMTLFFLVKVMRLADFFSPKSLHFPILCPFLHFKNFQPTIPNYSNVALK